MAYTERLTQTEYSFLEAEHLHRYAIACSLTAGKDVIDIACGEGYGSNLIARNAKSVIGVDIDQEIVDHASKKYADNQKKLIFRHGSLLKIPLDDQSVDVVVSFESIEHVEQHDLVLKEFKRVLRKNGLLVLSTPDKYYYSDISKQRNPFHIKEMYKSDLELHLAKYFKNHLLYQQRFLCGSLIRPYNSNKQDLKLYNGDFCEIQEKKINDGVYMVALASDNIVEYNETSFFDLTNLISQTQDNALARVYNSTSYKLGRKIVDVLNFFRKK